LYIAHRFTYQEKRMLDTYVIPDPIDRTSISDQVYLHVKALILSGTLKSGEKIPEMKVAERFKVSRTPVREAIRRLAQYGLVAIKPRSLAYVASISDKEARDISQVRLWLERFAARSFSLSATRESLEALRALARKCREANDRHDLAVVHECDSQLHLQIAEHTGNTELVRILQALDAKLQLLRLKQHVPSDLLNVYLDQHMVLIDLIEQGKTDQIDKLLEKHIVHDLNSPSSAS
jgi:DNA-binding GntR family transcriptional regulator